MKRLAALQGMRALAALAVVFLHAIIEVDRMARTRGGSFLGEVGMLHAGVDFFFVISGLIMVYSSRPLFEGTGSWKFFIRRRIARIVPLYWITMSAFLVLSIQARATINSPPPSAAEIIQSYLFVPYRNQLGDLQPVYKIGWTLDYEMFFYMVFAALVWLPAGKVVGALSVVMSALVAAGLLVPVTLVPFRFWTDPIVLEFVFGAWIGWALLRGRELSLRVAALLMAGGIVALAVLSALVAPRVVALGLPAAAIVAGATLIKPDVKIPDQAIRWINMLGDSSYALYLTHLFAVRSIAILGGVFFRPDYLDGWLRVAAMVAGAVILAVFVHLTVEKPLTLWLQSRLGVGQPKLPPCEPRYSG